MRILPRGIFDHRDKKKGKPERLTLKAGQKPPKDYVMTGTTVQERGDRGTPVTYYNYERGRSFIRDNAPQDWRNAQQQAAAPAPAAAPQAAAPGTLAVGDFPEPQGPDTSAQEALAATIAQMQQGFMQSIQQQQQMFQQMQASQTERMEALQNQIMQSQIAQQTRPEVAGVKMASGQAGTPMQIAKRGVSGAFGRKGMRIQSLNV